VRRTKIPWLVCLIALGCTANTADTFEASTRVDANRPCALAGQLELHWADAGTCSDAPIVVLSLGPDGSVTSASAHVPIGVTVPLIPCTASSAASASCAWSLDLACDGAHGEHLAITGAITRSSSAWSGDHVSVTLTGAPPARLSCAATGAVHD
jgi:hypothetical protein